MTEKTEPIRKSILPCVPPPEWEFGTVVATETGCVLLPSDEGRVVVRRRVSYGDWEPVRPDRWAGEPQSAAGLARQDFVPSAPAATDLRKRMARAARTVRLRLGPNAVAMTQRGEPIILNMSEGEAVADAVLAILPAPADRAAVLREAAEYYENVLTNTLAPDDVANDPRYCTAIRDIVMGLRHMADGAQQAGEDS